MFIQHNFGDGQINPPLKKEYCSTYNFRVQKNYSRLISNKLAVKLNDYVCTILRSHSIYIIVQLNVTV